MIQFDDCAYFSNGLVKNHQLVNLIFFMNLLGVQGWTGWTVDFFFYDIQIELQKTCLSEKRWAMSGYLLMHIRNPMVVNCIIHG